MRVVARTVSAQFGLLALLCALPLTAGAQSTKPIAQSTEIFPGPKMRINGIRNL
jgi:hypothetical protein